MLFKNAVHVHSLLEDLLVIAIILSTCTAVGKSKQWETIGG